jgi:hypothetical protein
VDKPDCAANLNHQRNGIARMISLADLMADHQEFHSDLQMDSFITLRSGGTLYGCYKQALRELATRIHALRERYFGIELVNVEIIEHDAAGSSRDKILARQKRMTLSAAESVLCDTEREFLRFYGQAAAIRESLEMQGVRFPLSPEARDHLDREMWVHQLKCRAAVEGFSQGRPAAVTLELIQALPPDMRRSVCEEVFGPDAPQRLMEWFLTYDCQVPPPKNIEYSDAKRLIGCSV